MKGRSQEKAHVRLQPACFSLVGKCFVDAGEWRSRVKGHVPHTSHGNEMNGNKTVDLILLVSSTIIVALSRKVDLGRLRETFCEVGNESVVTLGGSSS